MLIFPNMENTGNVQKKNMFLYRENFKALKIFMYVLDSRMVLLQHFGLCSKFELENIPGME